ncbi:TRAP transporter small permease [Granulosicoccus sp.]|nr:TRAP transporter small permease [Granulosicoccus sp.]MDB4223855.1 TRAP transporter small permease [Granulosicoccus sp.]
MKALLEKWVSRAAKYFAWLASFTLVVIMLFTFVDVIGRTFFGRALVGTVESVELLMGILVFSGLAFTELQRKHIVIETFQSLLPRPAKHISDVINTALATAIVGLLSWQLINKTLELIDDQEYTQILEIPYWPTAIIMSFGLVLFLLVLLLRLINTLLGNPEKGDEKGDGGHLNDKGDGGYLKDADGPVAREDEA